MSVHVTHHICPIGTLYHYYSHIAQYHLVGSEQCGVDMLVSYIDNVISLYLNMAV